MSKMLKDCTNEKHLLYPALAVMGCVEFKLRCSKLVGISPKREDMYLPTHMKLLEIKP